MTTRSLARRLPLLLALVPAALLAMSSAPATAQPAGAAVSVTSELGAATASDAGPTTLALTGAGFQSIEGGFGGVYVAFGWVAGEGWAPSQGGKSGETFLYVADTQSADNAGMLKFVAFPGSSTAVEANGGTLTADGGWATELVVSGPVVMVSDAAGNGREVDCRVETCGVLTFGAHGVVNANNETFTPVTFAGPGAVPSPTPTGTSGEPDGSHPSEGATADGTTAEGTTDETSPTPTVTSGEPDGSDPSEGATADGTTAEGATDETSPTPTGASGEPDGSDAGGSGRSAGFWVVAGSAFVAAAGAAAAVVLVRGRRKGEQGPPAA